ncbi:hypothetical protein QQM79_04790 [Marinobacteraceae bacterium S3BR75-40.1]
MKRFGHRRIPGPKSVSRCRLLAVVGMTFVLAGCAWQTRSQLSRYEQAFNGGDYEEAAELAGEFGDTDVDTGASDDLLWTLQQASALQAAGAYRKSIRLFDTTETFFRIYDQTAAYQRWIDQVTATLTNDAVLPYEGTLYDAIMVNSYKALDFMALGEWGNARVELNRARDRQRRAVDSFAEELAAERERLQQKPSGVSDMSEAESTAQQALARTRQQLAAWSIYPRFVNPFATWLEGFFRLVRAEASGDYGRAADNLKRAAGMVPDNPAVQSDWAWAEDLADGRRQIDDLPPTVWVLFENGLGPVKREERVQVPVIVSSDHHAAIWTGFAFPRLVLRDKAVGRLEAELSGQQAASSVLANMDAVVSTEFSERLPAIMTRALISSVAKTVLQYRLQKQAGGWGGLFALVYQIMTTQADTRSWSSLPKTLELAKLERGGSDNLVLELGRRHEVSLPESRFTLVWVRLPKIGAEPAIRVISLGDRARE